MNWLIAFLLLAGAFVALAYRLRRAPRTACLADLDVLCRVEVNRYAHVRRLFSPDDFHFLAGSRRGAGLVARLRRQRLYVLSLYLAEMRDDFYSLVAIGSLFAAAPTARNERFAERIAAMRLRFEALMLRMQFTLRLNKLLELPLDVVPLLRQIGSLRTQADNVLHRLTPQDLAILRDALRSD